jgi:hypothetical protein
VTSWTPRPTTVLTVVIVAATLLGTYAVAVAIGAGHAAGATLVPITRAALLRSVARVVETRLGADRLQILLARKGTTTGPSATLLAQQQQLAKIAGIQIPTSAGDNVTSPGAETYLAKVISGAGPELARQLSDLNSSDDFATLALRAGEADSTAVERHVTARLTANHADVVMNEWIGELSADASLQKAWALTETPRTIDVFIREALGDLPSAIAKQVATDVLFASVPPEEADARGSDLSARLAWGIAAVLFIGLWAAAMAVAVQQILTLKRGRTASAATLLVAAIVGVAVYRNQRFSPTALEVLGRFLQMLEAQRHTNIAGVSQVLTALAAAAAVVLLAAGWSVVQDVPTTAADDKSHESKLRERVDGLRMIFNAGAAFLVASTVEIATLYQWPAAVFGSGGELKTAAWMAGAFSGVLFSVILTLVYLPAASRLRAAVRATMSPADASDLLDSKGINDTTSQQIARILQALAPMLTAFPLSALGAALSQ